MRDYYSHELNSELNRWRKYGMKNQSILLLQIDNGLNRCTTYTIQYARLLATASFEASKLGRPFEQSFMQLKYPDSFANNLERMRFFDSPSIVARFYRQFKGWKIIELSDWVAETDAREFNMFLQYLSENQEEIQHIFMASVKSENAATPLYASLSGVLRLKKLIISFPSVDMLASYAINNLGERGFTIADDAYEAMADFIDAFYCLESFDGYAAMERVIKDIAFELHLANASHITKSDMANIHTGCTASSSKRKIGF